MAQHARARRVLRGILEVEVEERAWHDAVEPLLGSLARQLANSCPELGIRRYRLIRTGARSLPEPCPLPTAADPALEPRVSAESDFPQPVPEVVTDPTERLRRLARRYLAHAGGRRPDQKP